MIRFSCPNCGRKIAVPESTAGKKGRCPKCQTKLTVPSPPAAPTQRHPEPAKVAAPTARREPTATPSAASVEQTAATPERTVVGQQVKVDVQGPAPSRISHSLGIGSLVVGGLAFLVSVVPCIGILAFPVAALGALLGGVGLILAFIRKGHGAGYAIGGTLLSAVAMAISSAMWYATSKAVEELGTAFQEAPDSELETATAVTSLSSEVASTTSEPGEQEPTAKQQPEADSAPAPAAKPTTAKRSQSAEWADARNPIRCGRVEVKVVSARVAKVLLESTFGSSGVSKEAVLQIPLRITNFSDTAKIDYNTWRGGEFTITRDYAILKDNFGNSYKRIDFGFDTIPVGGVKQSESVYPQKSVSDVLVFEVPIKKAEYLLLELPAGNIEDKGMLRLQIPADMIEWQE